MKKIILAIVAAFVLSNVLTTVYYVITAAPNHMGNFQRPEYNYAGLMVNHLIYAMILVMTFRRWYRTGDGPVVRQAALYGLIMAAMMYLPQAFVVRSIWFVEFNAIFLANIVAHLSIGVIIGAVVGYVMNSGMAE
jgi:hypothetical protein